MENVGHPTTNYVYLGIINAPSPLDRAEPIYQNYIHAEGRALLCTENFARRDVLFGQAGVERLYMSDALASSCAWGA